MKIPRALIGSPANGTTLTSVTGYAFSERGPLAPIPGGNGNANVTSLPIQVDAAGALSYTLGDGAPQFSGVRFEAFLSPQLECLSEDARLGEAFFS